MRTSVVPDVFAEAGRAARPRNAVAVMSIAVVCFVLIIFHLLSFCKIIFS